jgi:hypothetical protein
MRIAPVGQTQAQALHPQQLILSSFRTGWQGSSLVRFSVISKYYPLFFPVLLSVLHSLSDVPHSCLPAAAKSAAAPFFV